MYETIKELVHLFAAECDHQADRHSDAQFETGNVLFRFAGDRSLSGKSGQMRSGFRHRVFFHFGADTGAQNDLLQLRHLHNIGDAELLFESRDHFFIVFFLHVRHNCSPICNQSFFLTLET